MELLPPDLTVAAIGRWLPEIFPEGTPNRTYVIRGMAAKTLFVMFYTSAVEGTGRWLRPDQVTKMTDRQAARVDNAAREKWALDSVAPGRMKSLPGRWYAANTREPIRDETLRAGLVALGAVIERSGLPTTSAKPRYAIARDFADMLLQLSAQNADATAILESWQESHLTAAALSRI